MELYGTFCLGEKFRNFMELCNGSDGTEQLWCENMSSSTRLKATRPQCRQCRTEPPPESAYKENLVEVRPCKFRVMRADRPTDRHSMLIIILHTLPGGEVANVAACKVVTSRKFFVFKFQAKVLLYKPRSLILNLFYILVG